MERVTSSSAFARLGAMFTLALCYVSWIPTLTTGQDVADRDFQSNVRPLLKRYCFECHADDVTEADIDLGSFNSTADVRKQTDTWLKVRAMINSGQMPPKESQQLRDAEREFLQTWVHELLARQAQASAGDPGPIILRRLNNAEYTHTVRDLTGIELLDPTRQFPVDGAAGEGFTNVGSGQGMSPALVQKYLDAAKSVAEHAVLLPDGLRFSRYTTRRDQTDELLARIQDFYRRFTADGGGAAVDLQGIRFETNQGGVLPIERYLVATLEERLSLTNAERTFEEVALERSLSPRYLAMLWAALSEEGDQDSSPLLTDLRDKWRSARVEDAAKLAEQIAAAQKSLWKFNPVGHVGRKDGPTRWLEPVSPIHTSQQLRIKLPDQPMNGEVVVYLTAGDAGDGHEDDWVVWSRPRIEYPDSETGESRPPVLIRDIRTIAATKDVDAPQPSFGLDPALFGSHPRGWQIDNDCLCVQAPNVLRVRLPSDLVAGAELVTTGVLHPKSGQDGSAQLRLLLEETDPDTLWPDQPILVGGDNSRRRLERGMSRYRHLFPPALCYARIVPVDEVVTLTLFHREDDHLRRLMLTEQEAAELDQLWDELYFVSREPLKLVVAYEQISEFATQDRPDLVKAFAPMRSVINRRADSFRRRQLECEPAQVHAVIQLANRAWRRNLTTADAKGLRLLYDQLRGDEIPHDEAIHMLLARVFAAPAFLYKIERPGTGSESTPVSDHELATRLSYFLWSSLPDEPLRAAADAQRLTGHPETLVQQTRRMLSDARIRRLAIQFACQWLHVRDFDKNDDKNEQRYPEFAELRGDMYEETVSFFEDMFRNDGSILDTIDANHTLINRSLARHYGIEWEEEGETGWRRIDNAHANGRGGVLGMATILASQSGASRTSPILRGNWIFETLLGQRLPRPPSDVPQLPEAVPQGLTARELIEQHSSSAACAKCHAKIDPFGFALEQYDAIGRLRSHRVNTKTTLESGEEIEGLAGLRDYLLHQRRSDFVAQFCRKLLGYALGREVQLSDEPLLAEMQRKLDHDGYRFSVAVESIVTSDQFRKIRGQEHTE